MQYHDLAKENYRFVRVVERGSGEQARLRLFDDMEYHPVSYTHLDVYKRQGSHHQGQNPHCDPKWRHANIQPEGSQHTRRGCQMCIRDRSQLFR